MNLYSNCTLEKRKDRVIFRALALVVLEYDETIGACLFLSGGRVPSFIGSVHRILLHTIAVHILWHMDISIV